MKRIAAIVTVYRKLSHAQVICDRFLRGYFIRGEHHVPPLRLVSMYVDQFPEDDLSRDRAERYGFTIHHTIAGALRNGGRELSVDGVLLIGEHGDYPKNELGQTLYPRHEFYRQIVRVFQQDGRSVPVFVDKHLSYDIEKAFWMVEEARRGGFGLMAGSSIPLTWRLPPLELPLGCEIESALVVGYGPMDSYDFHALEGLQCMVERRGDGETGVRAVHYLEGDAVWEAGESGLWSYELLEAAMSRSDTPQGHAVEDGRPENLVALGYLPDLVENPAAYIVEYADGLRGTVLMLNGATRDILFAARLKGEPKPVSTQFFLPPMPNVNHFSGLAAQIEALILEGRSRIPVERTLLTTGVLAMCLRARHEGVTRLETPELSEIRYAPPADSQYLRD